MLVTFDAFPVQMLMDEKSHIDAGRFPNFARFARGGTWYPNATNVHENTVFSVPSILDGKVPRAGQEPTVQDHPENLFTLLGRTYEMRVSEEATNLCPARLCERPNDPGGAARLTQLADDASIVYSYLVAPDALRERLPSINDRWRNFRDSEGRGEAVPRNGVLSRLAGGERPQRFRGAVAAIRARQAADARLHPHAAAARAARVPARGAALQGRARSATRASTGRRPTTTPFLTDQAFQRHLLQAGYVDRLLGELVGQLQREGLWDRALVVLTADHGESFRVKPTPAPPFALGRLGYRRDLTQENAQDIVTVPLFVKYPEQAEGRIDPTWGRTIDVLPTIADVLGIRLPFRVDGRSLRAPRPVPDSLQFRKSDGSPDRRRPRGARARQGGVAVPSDRAARDQDVGPRLPHRPASRADRPRRREPRDAAPRAAEGERRGRGQARAGRPRFERLAVADRRAAERRRPGRPRPGVRAERPHRRAWAAASRTSARTD